MPVTLYSDYATGYADSTGPGVAIVEKTGLGGAYVANWKRIDLGSSVSFPGPTSWRIRILRNSVPATDPSLPLKYGDQFLLESIGGDTNGQFLAANRGGQEDPTHTSCNVGAGWDVAGQSGLFLRSYPDLNDSYNPWFRWTVKKCSGDGDFVVIDRHTMNLLSSDGAAVAFGGQIFQGTAGGRVLCAIGREQCSTSRPADITKVMKILAPNATGNWTAPTLTCDSQCQTQYWDQCILTNPNCGGTSPGEGDDDNGGDDEDNTKPPKTPIKWWVYALGIGGLLLLIGIIILVVYLARRKKPSTQVTQS